MEPTLDRIKEIDRAGKHIVAWQGVRIVAPEDWEPGAFSGDWGGGYIRLDERLAPRLVIRWLPEDSTDKLFKKASSRAEAIRQVADNYLASLEKAQKKKRNEVFHEKADRLVPRRYLDVSPAAFFQWRSEGRRETTYGVGFAGECTTSGRILLCECTGEDEEENLASAAELLSTLRPYPESDDSVLWSTFGLRFLLPKEWTLAGSKLVGGRIEFQFKREDESKLAVQRWIANLAMGKGDLVSWAKKQLASELKREYQFRMERGRCLGHDAVLAEGTLRSAKERVVHGTRRFLKIETPFHLVSRAWHCEPENKIFVVRAVCKESEKELADDIVAQFVCHVE
ncbi:MAG: hypothetical protein GF320_19755 [Armatimonadia bacterium]|nr:hypothetical protein [Armatimonadia bacterium]